VRWKTAFRVVKTRDLGKVYPPRNVWKRLKTKLPQRARKGGGGRGCLRREERNAGAEKLLKKERGGGLPKSASTKRSSSENFVRR